MFKRIIKNNLGVTLLEMIVAVAMFSVVVISATQIFKMVIGGQRNAIAAQNVQESIRYSLEVMSKEIRMAQRTSLGAGPPECGMVKGTVYRTVSGDNLILKNYQGECVEYYLEEDANGISRLRVDRGANSAYVTPDDIQVSNLGISITQAMGVVQPIVTIKMDIEAVAKEMHKQEMTVQTTISSRYYE